MGMERGPICIFAILNPMTSKRKKKNHVILVFYQAHYMLFIRYDKDETPGERRENLKHNFAIFFRFKKKKKKRLYD
jgi:hypothetical protein